MFIRTEDVSGILSACFGQDADPDGEAARALAEILRGWMPRRASPEALDAALQDVLIRHLRRTLGAQMLILDGIRWRRVRTTDLDDAADRLTGLALAALPENEESYELVRDRAVRGGSVSAMECLTKRFAACQSSEERAMIAKVLSYRLAERDANGET